MQNFDDVYDLMGFNEDMNILHSEKEEDRLVSEENENENKPHFERANIVYANPNLIN
jgi:hypothetical protein